jgi:hypothetical protein
MSNDTLSWPEEEPDQNVEERYPEEARDTDTSDTAPAGDASTTDPAMPPPEPTNG